MSSGVKEKVAYLQGLTKGLNVSDSSAEGKLFINIIEVLDGFAEEIEELSVSQAELGEYVETIDEDLCELEEDIYEDEPLDDGYVEVECPKCHDTVAFEAEVMNADETVEVSCPECGTIVYESSEEPVSDWSGVHPGL